MDRDLAARQRIATRAVIAGLLLFCYALARMFSDSEAGGNVATPHVEVSGPVPAPSIDVPALINSETSTPALPRPSDSHQRETAPQIPIAEDEVVPMESDLAADESLPDVRDAVQSAPAALQTYYAEVENSRGGVETIRLSAPSADRAKEIIRDFRGDPKVIHGPSTEVSW